MGRSRRRGQAGAGLGRSLTCARPAHGTNRLETCVRIYSDPTGADAESSEAWLTQMQRERPVTRRTCSDERRRSESQTSPASDPSALDDLRSQLSGRVGVPGEETYQLATPWDRSVPVNPAAVVAVAAAADVAEVVRFAATHRWRVAVQATGHGAVPLSGDSILVHTGQLQECAVDATAQSVRVGAGVTWQQVLDVVTPHGLAALCGSSVNVGAVGFLTGGGIGPLSRPRGLSSDYVSALEVITGDGQQRRVTADSEPDLFWALRGGKSYLGIVTAAEMGLLPIREVYGGSVFFDGAGLAAVLHTWRDWAADLPDTADTSVAIMQMPPLPEIPAPLAGKITVSVRYTDLAEADEAERTLAPMLAVATPIFGGTGVLPYGRIGEVHNDPVAPSPTAHNTALLAALPDDAIEQLVRLAGPDSGSPQTLVELRQLGGALAEPIGPASAFTGGRKAAYNLYVTGNPNVAPRETLRAHSNGLISALSRSTTGQKLINFADSSDPLQLRSCFDAATLTRLSELADHYDPANVVARPLRAATGN